MILHAESLIVQRGQNARLNLDEDIIFETLIHPERKLIPKCTATEIVNAMVFPRTACRFCTVGWINDYLKAVYNRSEICFGKNAKIYYSTILNNKQWYFVWPYVQSGKR